MTNFENMKQKIIGTVSRMDEMELLRLAEDTEMSACGAEGVFCCTVCEKEFGGCGAGPCNSEHNSRYLEWCRKEHMEPSRTVQGRQGTGG